MTAPMFQLNFQPTDLINMTSTTSIGSSATTMTGNTEQGTSSPALSTGGIAAVATFAPVVTLAALGATVFLLWRRRRQKRSSEGIEHSESRPGLVRRETEPQVSEVGGNEASS